MTIPFTVFFIPVWALAALSVLTVLFMVVDDRVKREKYTPEEMFIAVGLLLLEIPLIVAWGFVIVPLYVACTPAGVAAIAVTTGLALFLTEGKVKAKVTDLDLLREAPAYMLVNYACAAMAVVGWQWMGILGVPLGFAAGYLLIGTPLLVQGAVGTCKEKMRHYHSRPSAAIESSPRIFS